MMSSQAQERGTVQSQGNSARNDDEGSFAAALRKLAQQAIVPVGRGHSSRDRQSSPSVGTPKSAFHGKLFEFFTLCHVLKFIFLDIEEVIICFLLMLSDGEAYSFPNIPLKCYFYQLLHQYNKILHRANVLWN